MPYSIQTALQKNLALGTLSSNFNQYNPASTIFVAGNRHVYILWFDKKEYRGNPVWNTAY